MFRFFSVCYFELHKFFTYYIYKLIDISSLNKQQHDYELLKNNNISIITKMRVKTICITYKINFKLKI